MPHHAIGLGRIGHRALCHLRGSSDVPRHGADRVGNRFGGLRHSLDTAGGIVRYRNDAAGLRLYARGGAGQCIGIAVHGVRRLRHLPDETAHRVFEALGERHRVGALFRVCPRIRFQRVGVGAGRRCDGTFGSTQRLGGEREQRRHLVGEPAQNGGFEDHDPGVQENAREIRAIRVKGGR